MYVYALCCIRHVEPYKLNPYNVYGACLAEAEVDILTGDRKIIQADAVFDFGERFESII